MGFLWLEAWGTKDTAIIEEIAKEYKLEPEKVEKAYKKMLEELKDEIKK